MFARFFCNWRSDSRHRTKAVPHIKSYTKIDESNSKAAYFLLTSANVSKAAWGKVNKAGDLSLIHISEPTRPY